MFGSRQRCVTRGRYSDRIEKSFSSTIPRPPINFFHNRRPPVHPISRNTMPYSFTPSNIYSPTFPSPKTAGPFSYRPPVQNQMTANASSNPNRPQWNENYFQQPQALPNPCHTSIQRIATPVLAHLPSPTRPQIEFNRYHSATNSIAGLHDHFWIEATSLNGESYYYHAHSRQTQWDRPDNVPIMKYQELRNIFSQNGAFQTQTFLGVVNSPPPNIEITLQTPNGVDTTFTPLFGDGPPSVVSEPYACPILQKNQYSSNDICSKENVNPNSTVDMITSENEDLKHNTEDQECDVDNSLNLVTNMNSCENSGSILQSEIIVDVNDVETRSFSSILHMKNESFKSSIERVDNNTLSIGDINHVLPSSNIDEKATGTFIEDKLTKEKSIHADKSRPVSSTPIPCTKWCVVWTGDKKVFFYDSELKQSVWEAPIELEHRDDVKQLLKTPPQIYESKTHETDCEPDVKKFKTNDSESTTIREAVLKNDTSDHTKLPRETRIELFRAMLSEKQVSAFSTWEKDVVKIVFDRRYSLLHHKDRRQVYDAYVRETVENAREKRKRDASEVRKQFRALLKDSGITIESRFCDFEHKHCKDERFGAVEKAKDRKDYFLEFVDDILKKHSERRKLDQEVDKNFKELLVEQSLSPDSRWSDVKETISRDSRYVAVDSDFKREKLFDEYLYLEKNRTFEDRQDRIKHSISRRMKQVQQDMSVHMKELEKERSLRKHNEIVNNFQTLLMDLVRNPNMSWKSTRKILKTDHRWIKVRNLTHDEHERLFEEHCKYLSSKRSRDFHKFLGNINNIKLTSSWKDIRDLVMKDPECQKFSKDEKKCEKEFESFIKDRIQKSKSDFWSLLRETKMITHNSKNLMEGTNHLKNILDTLSNDRRFLVMKYFPEDRTEMLKSYIKKLHQRGPPPPPTAYNRPERSP